MSETFYIAPEIINNFNLQVKFLSPFHHIILYLIILWIFLIFI